MADIFGGINDTIMDTIQSILYATIYKLLYYLAVGCCWIVNLLYSMFEVMAGLSKVSYDGDYDYLINVFFSNTTVSKVYWGMALIGLVVGFAFAIAAVIKKLFDSNEKEKRSYGQILTSLFKSTLTILCMSLIITMVLNATTLLMQQINYIFVNADSLGDKESITYTDEEYAAMTRVFNTIGNFSLNPSYNNRYNLNKCFNEIRFDLQYLKSHGVFDFHYVTTDMEGNTIATWQSTLQKIANSASLDRDLSLDAYHESTSKAILAAMDLVKVNGSFKPLEEYHRQYQASRSSLSMDRLLFLMASMRAAKNEDYNLNPSLTDSLRGAYYYGEKSIYDLDTVNEDFDIGIAAMDYVILFLTCYKMLETLATIILNCVGRIFNMLLLYLISPLVIAVSPLDDGAKFKQWTTAFIVQSFSVFGTVISMRVLLLFMPVVVDPKLVLFESPIGNLLAKLVIILGAFEVAEKATNLITGILADNAGWQSITAGDMSSAAKTAVGYGWRAAKGVGGFGLSAAGLGMKGGVKAAGIGAMAAGGAGLLAGYGVYGLGKGAYVGTKALANKISAWRSSGQSNAGGGGQGTGSAGDDSNPTNKQTDSLPTSQRDSGSSNEGEDNENSQPIGGGNENGAPSITQGTNNDIPNSQHGAGQQNPTTNTTGSTGTNTQGINNDIPNSRHGAGQQNPTTNITGGTGANPQINGGGQNNQTVSNARTNHTNPPSQRGTQQTAPPNGTNGTGANPQITGPTNTNTNAQGINNDTPNSRHGAGQQNPTTNITGGTGANPQRNGGGQNNQTVSNTRTNHTNPTSQRGTGQQAAPPNGTNGTGANPQITGPTNTNTNAQGINNDLPNSRHGTGQQNPTTNITGGTGANPQGNNGGGLNNTSAPNQGTNSTGNRNQVGGNQPNPPVQETNKVSYSNPNPVATVPADAPYRPSANIGAMAEAIQKAQAAAANPLGSDVTKQINPKKHPPKSLPQKQHGNNT